MQLVGYGSKGHHYFVLNANENALNASDIASNSSRVLVSFQLAPSSTGWNWEQWGSAITWTVNVNGQVRSGTIPAYDGYSTLGLLSETFTISHDASGSKSISVSFSVSDTSGQYYTCGDTSANGQMALATIPRATKLPSLNVDIERLYTIPLNPASPTFNHSLAINTSGDTWEYVNQGGNLQEEEYKFFNRTSIPFIVPASFYSLFTGKSTELNMKLNTYSGSRLIGSSEAKLTVTCNQTNCSPYFTATVVDSNSTTIALTGSSTKIIKGYSTAKVSLSSLRAAYSTKDTNSTITVRKIDGVTVTGTSREIKNAVSSTFTIVIENSRGFSTSLTVGSASNLIDYFAPQIIIDPKRVSQTSNTVKLTYSGTFFNQSFGKVANAISSMKWYYKKSGATSWTTGGTITPTISGNTIKETTLTLNGSFSYQESFRFKVECIDKLATSIKEADVPIGTPIFSHGKNWFQHHTPIYLQSNHEVLDYEVIEEWNE